MPVREVERAGRLVAQQHVRALGDGARDRDALLLAAGELRREVVEALAQPDQRERLLGRHRIVRDVGDQRDVLARGQAGDEVVELEHEPDVVPPVLRELFLVGVGEVAASEEDPPGRWRRRARRECSAASTCRCRRAQQHEQLARVKLKSTPSSARTSTSPMR